MSASAQTRLEALDVLRGVAVLGMLLVNIALFGLESQAQSSPALSFSHALDPWLWSLVELLAAGSMRALFCLLFGASLLLMTLRPAVISPVQLIKRQSTLLCFGLINAYLLLNSGDILIIYAVCGTLLYPVRELPAQRLLWAAVALLVGLSLLHVVNALQPFDAQPLADQLHARVAERDIRQQAYAALFVWNLARVHEVVCMALPLYQVWDALALMLLGMALFKMSALQTVGPHTRWLLLALPLGLLLNAVEVLQSWRSEFDMLYVAPQLQPTYHLGRTLLALGYIGCVLHWHQYRQLRARGGVLWSRLAAVGRMALSNYLMQSMLGLLIFSGAGLGLVGALAWWQMHALVLALWCLQLWISPWWLQRFASGPIEWLCRKLSGMDGLAVARARSSS